MKVGIKSVAAGVITVGYYPDSANLSGAPGTWPVSVRDVTYSTDADIGSVLSDIYSQASNFFNAKASGPAGALLVGRVFTV